MAHFAKLDDNNVVIAVHVVNNDALDPMDEETSGIEFLTKLHGYSNWKQTSYNGTFRFHYAGIGYTYFSDADAFVPPKPTCGHPKLTLNQSNYRWECDNAEHEPIL